jgi:hypothetical protein
MPRLTSLHPLMRLGIALLVVTLLGGYIVSGLHMMWHYDTRDGLPELTLDDIRGHYHGVQSPSPLIAALESDHPPRTRAVGPRRAAQVAAVRHKPLGAVRRSGPGRRSPG